MCSFVAGSVLFGLGLFCVVLFSFGYWILLGVGYVGGFVCWLVWLGAIGSADSIGLRVRCVVG